MQSSQVVTKARALVRLGLEAQKKTCVNPRHTQEIADSLCSK